MSLATTLLSQNALGNALVTCWIDNKHLLEQFLYFFILLCIGWLTVAFTSLYIIFVLPKHLSYPTGWYLSSWIN